MATKSQKITGAVIGTITGALAGYFYASANNVSEKDIWKYTLAGATGGAFGGYGVACLFGSPNDTIQIIVI